MSTPVEIRASARQEDARLSKREKWKAAIILSAVSCEIIAAFGLAVYIFGVEATTDSTVRALALGAVVYLGAVVCFRTFWGPR